MRKIFIYILLGLSTLNLKAEPSKIILQSITTPATVLDVYLFNMKENSKCHSTYWGYPKKQKLDECVGGIDYSYADNTFTFYYVIFSDSKTSEYYSSSMKTSKQIKEILRKALDDAATTVGVKPVVNDFYAGLISTPIHNGYSKKDFDVNEFHKEVRNRTIVKLTFWKNKKRYTAVRQHDGEIFLDTEAK